jgi:leucyl-tRNA synthetase
VEKQGADAGRIYEMFIGPPEEDVEWTDSGLNGVVRFLQRVWRLVLEPESIVVESSGADVSLLRRKAAQTVKKVTDHFNELRFNTAVAALMELANSMQSHLQNGGERDAEWDLTVRDLVKLLNPLAPHVCEEMWERLGERGMLADSTWPEFDAAAAAVPEVTVVVQVAGKLRDRLSLPVGTSQEVVLEAALASDKVRGALNGRGPSKVIFVQDRLINLVP